jgi:phage terminase small subunit
MTPKQQRFVEEYCRDCNATQAAIRAGYGEKSARFVGHENLTKPYIQAAVQARLKELSLGAEETTKLISDIARTSLNDFFTVKEVEHTPRVKKHLSILINETLAHIEFEDAYANRVGLEGDELKHHEAAQERREKQVIRMELELERNPNAYRWVDGETQLAEVAELDLVRLVKAKEGGRIKSVTPSEHGLKVELYAADAALRDIAKMHGLLIEKKESTSTNTNFNYNAELTKEEVQQISKDLEEEY